MEEQSTPSPQETITTSDSVDDVSNSSIPTPTDFDPVRQIVEIIPSQSLNPVEPSTTVPVKDPFINSVSSFSNHNIPNQQTNSVYPNHSLDPIPIQGTAPKKKYHSGTSNLQYSFHSVPWREGSRPLSITHSTAQSIDSIAETKHPPLPSHFTPPFILYSDSSVSCRNLFKKTSYLFDEPWPDDLSHSFNCSYTVPPIALYPRSRPSAIFTPHHQSTYVH
ncbi:hypothetical protein PRIPAC_97123 [Pristionchus pacificus]|uniref:Uncharacterized protein n=1 Tax=Pristionchus pacificus TaxID=54126 RepID=A0A2A6BCJ6_PRIPA|nr:hypothetical protein PRIPAC_97123 [Pristionchus pacificus]|eukprot:PDM63612.1 hypothetical protein PRIPAC_49585 [Pristionchus pacificus]